MIREKENGKTVVYEVILQRRCDVPMAEKKGYLPCDGGIKCHTCHACLEQVDNGEWRHCDPLRGKTKYQARAKW